MSYRVLGSNLTLCTFSQVVGTEAAEVIINIENPPWPEKKIEQIEIGQQKKKTRSDSRSDEEEKKGAEDNFFLQANH